MPSNKSYAHPVKAVLVSIAAVVVALVGLLVFNSAQVGAAESVTTGSVRPVGSGSGPYQWGEHVTLQGFDWNGRPASINTVPAWKDKVIGVSGGRWGDQIDYTSENGGKGESIVISFDRPVSNVTLEMGMVGAGEGGTSGTTPIDEAGTWTALGANGQSVGKGRISPDQSSLGARTKQPGSYGLYPIAVRASAPIYQIRIDAIAWGTTAKTFADKPGSTSGGVLNNSDIGLTGLRYSFISPVENTTSTAAPATSSTTTAPDRTPTTNSPTTSSTSDTSTKQAPSTTATTAPESTQPSTTSGRDHDDDQPQRSPFVLDVAELSVVDGIGQWSRASITARNFDGDATQLGVRQGVVGPIGGRYDYQLDVDTSSVRSEQLVVHFDAPATVTAFSVKHLESSEFKGLPETGVWRAFDAAGTLLKSATFAGSDAPVVNGVRSFTIPPVSGVSRLTFEATHYGHGANSSRTDNQSDFALASITAKTDPGLSLETSVLDITDLSVTDGVGRWPGALVTARGFDGTAAELDVTRGIAGVVGGRYKFQVDVDTKTNRSEQIVVDFDVPTVLTGFSVKHLESSEFMGLAETGTWRALDANGSSLRSGTFAGSDVADDKGVRTFTIPAVSGVSRLVFEATHYGHGENSERTDNQSDFALKSVSVQGVAPTTVTPKLP